ncbi:hypothetical protein [Neisseria sp. oral taxon 014]|uniref:hypothetical protein n=1 Tax=Neisseria sp. oral taxon 014 TaxID=641148 RepID=UPI0025E068D9|nr:hypothetical protein [Neisseria sp. oral taxon 014]
MENIEKEYIKRELENSGLSLSIIDEIIIFLEQYYSIINSLKKILKDMGVLNTNNIDEILRELIENGLLKDLRSPRKIKEFLESKRVLAKKSEPISNKGINALGSGNNIFNKIELEKMSSYQRSDESSNQDVSPYKLDTINRKSDEGQKESTHRHVLSGLLEANIAAMKKDSCENEEENYDRKHSQGITDKKK